MSLMLMAQSMKVKLGNPLRKLVLIKLADHADDNGEAYPSFQHIADQCEISRRSVINHIESLEKMGLVSIETREGRYKRNSSNLYVLNVDEIERLSKIKPNEQRPTSAGDSTTSAGDSPSTSAGAAPRITNSSESVKEVLVHLNQMAGTSYRPVDSNLRLIEARLKEGATVADMKRVIDAKCAEWKGGDMEKYLRPQTLFNASKFEQYLGALGKPADDPDQSQPTGKDWI